MLLEAILAMRTGYNLLRFPGHLVKLNTAAELWKSDDNSEER
jgi:hypothetical protein